MADRSNNNPPDPAQMSFGRDRHRSSRREASEEGGHAEPRSTLFTRRYSSLAPRCRQHGDAVRLAWHAE
jgi:hypothetical protein